MATSEYFLLEPGCLGQFY